MPGNSKRLVSISVRGLEGMPDLDLLLHPMTALIGRLYEVTEGRLLIDGIDIREITRTSLASQMSAVLQEPYLFSGTVRENIRYGRLDATDEEVEEAAALVGAHEFISRLENGYDTELHERGQNISVGQRQLISFARAIIARPRILILNNALATLELSVQGRIVQALRREMKGRALILVSDNAGLAAGFDEALVMREGRVVERGPVERLAKSGTALAELGGLAPARGAKPEAAPEPAGAA